MERTGRHFEFGYPHFNSGINYNWPDEAEDYFAMLKEKKEELAPILLKRLTGYIVEFRIRTYMPPYPHIQRGTTGLVLHLGDGGRWISLGREIGAWFLSEHNLDAYAERAACLNIGSDTLEFLDDSILAPRVSVEKGEYRKYIIKYPLPKGMKTIDNPRLNQETVTHLAELVNWAGTKLVVEEGMQRLEYKSGAITIKEGMCEGRGFEKWDNPRASWVMSKLMSLC